MPAYSVILMTASDCSYSLSVPTIEQAAVNSNPFIIIGELIESPEQLLTLPHTDAQDPDGDSPSFSIATADGWRDARYGPAQAQRLFLRSDKALSDFRLGGYLSEVQTLRSPNKTALALVKYALWKPRSCWGQ